MSNERDRIPSCLGQHRLTRRDLMKLGAAGLAAAGLAGIPGCSPAPSTPAAPAPATTTGAASAPASTPSRTDIIIARPEEIQKMDAYDQYNLVNYDLYLHLFDPMVELDEKGTYVPGLAESWETSADGLAWTFKLRKGVKFHDGDTFTSKAVKMNIERLKDKKLARSTYWGALDKVDTPDDYTAIIRTTKPMGTMLVNLLTPMGYYSPKSIDAGGNFWDKPMGTGPFKFVEWKKNEQFVLEANPDYWKGAPKLKKITYRPIMEDQTRVAALRNGEIDIVDTLPPDQVKLISDDPKLTVLRGIAWDQAYIGLKSDKPPFDKVEARQAVNYAIDRASLVEKLLQGGKAAVGPIPEPMMGYASALKPYPFDPEKAKSLLKTAGWSGGKLKFIAPDGWYPKMKEVAESISSLLKAVGLDNDLTVMEGAAFTQARGAGDYNMYITGGASRDPDDLIDQRIRQDIFKSGYKNDKVFDMIVQGQTTIDMKKRGEIYQSMQEILYNEGPMVWLYQMEAIYGMKKGINGFRTYPYKVWDLRTASWG